MKIRRFVVGVLLTNCYILSSGNEAAVIDPGGGLKRILKELQSLGAKLKYIILTHYHLDHTICAMPLKKETGAEILIHEAEKDYISIEHEKYSENRVLSEGKKYLEKYTKLEADKFLTDGQEIKIGESVLKVIRTPGHSKGSICLLGDNFVFTGDTIFNDALGRIDLPGGSKKELDESLSKMENILKSGMTVYPGHFEIFEVK